MTFNAVGAIGMVVHFGLLGFFVHVLGMHYLWATGLSIEAAIFQNFSLHRRWTWADRRVTGCGPVGAELLRFNLTTGLVSLAGYSLSAWILTGFWSVDPVVANVVGLIPTGLANFFLADKFVFPATTGAGTAAPEVNHDQENRDPHPPEPGLSQTSLLCASGADTPVQPALYVLPYSRRTDT